MSTNASIAESRAGYSDAPQGAEKVHTLIAFVEDRPGAIDRVVGVLRRKRARLQSLSLAQSDKQEIVRITAQVKDAEVHVENLVEQIRKVIDVKQIINLTTERAIVRELAVIKVAAQAEQFTPLVETGNQFGAAIVDIVPGAVVFEATGSAEKLEKLISALHPFGILEIARSGNVAIARTADDK